MEELEQEIMLMMGIYVLKHPTEHRFLTFDDIDIALNILLPLNYTVNEVLTKIEVKLMKQLVYVFNK